MIPVHEILHTILGEGSLAGIRCAVVRTFGCNLRCRWCDTPQDDVTPRSLGVGEIVKIALRTRAPAVLVTGGEPLIHPQIPLLCARLTEKGLAVLVETNGSLDVSVLPLRVLKIMDLKPPSSGFDKRNLLANIRLLDRKDEVKIVMADRNDYVWAKKMIRRRLVSFPGTINLSPVMKGSIPRKLARWILEDRLPVRFNLQLHKILFPSGENVIF